MQQIYEDKTLGEIVLRKNVRSRQYTLRVRAGKITVSLPVYGSYKKALDLVNEHRQVLLSKIEETQQNCPAISEEALKELRTRASKYLPIRLRQLSDEHGLIYESVRVSQSKSRWGSCSSKASINLSLYLMNLPSHLIDYVLLHELCHTIEMNHGENFWKLMDIVCEGRTMSLRRELKKYKIF